MKKKTKTETIAIALGKYLEKYDWNVFKPPVQCPNCDKELNMHVNPDFCYECGVCLKQAKQFNEEDVINVLYGAYMAGRRAAKSYEN